MKAATLPGLVIKGVSRFPCRSKSLHASWSQSGSSGNYQVNDYSGALTHSPGQRRTAFEVAPAVGMQGGSHRVLPLTGAGTLIWAALRLGYELLGRKPGLGVPQHLPKFLGHSPALRGAPLWDSQIGWEILASPLLYLVQIAS